MAFYTFLFLHCYCALLHYDINTTIKQFKPFQTNNSNNTGTEAVADFFETPANLQLSFVNS